MANRTKTNIISWNTQGLRTSRQELQLIINNLEPSIICLQETMCKTDKVAEIRGYNAIHRQRQTSNRAAGGIITAIKNGIDYTEILLNTQMEITAVKVESPINATILNIYIPPNVVIPKNEITGILTQIPKPFIMTGDMNAHHHLWGSEFINNRGEILEEIFNEMDLMVLNNGDCAKKVHKFIDQAGLTKYI